MKTNQKGFTLIEILVVIGIIAILAAVVLLAINPARQFRLANDSQRTSNVNAILNAIGQFMADNNGALPADANDGVVGTFETIGDDNATQADICALLIPTYIPSLPTDPTTGDGNGDGTVDGNAVTACALYDTDYKIDIEAAGLVTIAADGQEPAGVNNIAVTR